MIFPNPGDCEIEIQFYMYCIMVLILQNLSILMNFHVFLGQNAEFSFTCTVITCTYLVDTMNFNKISWVLGMKCFVSVIVQDN